MILYLSARSLLALGKCDHKRESPALTVSSYPFLCFFQTLESSTFVHLLSTSEDHDIFAQTVHNAIDSYGISIPLINFHPHRRCAGSESSIVKRHPYVVTRSGHSRSESYQHILTKPPRTFLRVVKMTKLYDSKAYEDHQRTLLRQMVRGMKHKSWAVV